MTSRPLRVVLSPEAESDIEDIFLYGVEEHGVATASGYVEGLREAPARLADHPFIG